MPKTITIPKELTRNADDFVAISHKDYEEFLKFRAEQRPQVKLTKVQKRAIDAARKRMATGKYLTIDELKQKLEFEN